MQMEKKEEMKRGQQQVIVKKKNTKFNPAGFFAKILIVNQIRPFWLFQTFRLVSTYPAFRHPALLSVLRYNRETDTGSRTTNPGWSNWLRLINSGNEDGDIMDHETVNQV